MKNQYCIFTVQLVASGITEASHRNAPLSCLWLIEEIIIANLQG